jgi:hypothetical protein
MTFEEIIHTHQQRYPLMEIQDVYKLIHQAALGSEHALVSPESVRQWLYCEVSQMGSGPDEPLIDPISTEGQIVRIHLRPFIAQGYDLKLLLNAFIQTAIEYRGDVKMIENYWEVASRLGYYQCSEMKTFLRDKKGEGFPAAHHSLVFAKNYRPAYRVICKDYLLQDIK